MHFLQFLSSKSTFNHDHWISLPEKEQEKTKTLSQFLRWRKETRTSVIVNTSLIYIINLYLLIAASLNLATTLYPEVHHRPALDTTVGCNGRLEYCNRTYDNISQIGTHGSAFWGILPTHNQNMGIVAQLTAGIRFLQVQTHPSPVFKQMKACHTSCLAEDAGTLEDYLKRVKHFLLQPGHEREVVTILITNGEYVDVAAYDNVIRKVNLTGLVYTPGTVPRQPPSNATDAAAKPLVRPSAWPTLQEMIDANQRLVLFLDYGANPAKVPYLLDEFAHFWESPFDTIDPEFNQCNVDRPVVTSRNKAEVEGRMYILNHYLDTKVVGGMVVPNRKHAKWTNHLEGPSGIARQVERCEREHGGRRPRVVLVDYFDVGDWLGVEGWLNGLEGGR